MAGKIRTGIAILGISLLLASCIEVRHHYDQLPPGPWRGELYLDQQTTFRPGGQAPTPGQRAAVPDDRLPFNFEVRYNDADQMEAVFRNAAEEVVVTDIAFGRDMTIAKDTLTMRFPGSENYLRAVFAENAMQGYWVVPSRSNYRVPFEAQFGQNHRFALPANTKIEDAENFDGRWDVVFNPGSDNPNPAIGEFEQSNLQITGTFMTNTGDYRFLQGNVEDDKLWLSTFDGVFAFLFGAKKFEDGSVEGFFRSGSHYEAEWTARRGEETRLEDPTTITRFKSDRLEFTALDIDGQEVTSEKYEGKPLVVLVSGSWCPNCKDAKQLLHELTSDKDLDVVVLSFERYREKERALPLLKNYNRDLELDLHFYLAGYFDREEAAAKLGIEDRVQSFPTTIFLDSEHRIVSTYTGFSGPATSGYEPLSRHFSEEIKKLTGE
ncbi:MAG: TlpA family protein disulfide reductase [Saprospirales bacterium]|nr:MAG: TlpA family protein disulfide reductase [Saprospirales bacterium]